jgi:hypothetical protein
MRVRIPAYVWESYLYGGIPTHEGIPAQRGALVKGGSTAEREILLMGVWDYVVPLQVRLKVQQLHWLLNLSCAKYSRSSHCFFDIGHPVCLLFVNQIPNPQKQRS